MFKNFFRNIFTLSRCFGGFKKLLHPILLFGTILFLSGCASKEKHTHCAPVSDPNAESHIGTQKVGDHCTMLHLVGASCARVGDNLFHLYAIDCTIYGLAPPLQPAHTEDERGPGHTEEPHLDPVTVVSVTGVHLEMGHGLSTPPEILENFPDRFRVRFPMAGHYRLDITYRREITGPSLPATHEVEVEP